MNFVMAFLTKESLWLSGIGAQNPKVLDSIPWRGLRRFSLPHAHEKTQKGFFFQNFCQVLLKHEGMV